MADTYIDNLEILAYGPYSSERMRSLSLGLDPEFDAVIAKVAARLDGAVAAAQSAMEAAGMIERPTLTSAAASGNDPVAGARDVIRRTVAYVDSRGLDSSRLLQGKNLTIVMRYRPVKLAGVLANALNVLDNDKAKLPEYAERRAAVAASLDALNALSKQVKDAKLESKQMTPEVQARRDDFLRVYMTAKHLVRSVLTSCNKLELMSEIFDDLAEVQRTKPAEGPVTPPVVTDPTT